MTASIVFPDSYTTDTDASTITFDASTPVGHSVTIAGNRVLAITGDSDGQGVAVRIIQDGTGGRTVTWWSGITWNDGGTPRLETAPGSADLFSIRRVSSGVYEGAHWSKRREIEYDIAAAATLSPADLDLYFNCKGASYTITLPAATGARGRELEFLMDASIAGLVTLAASGAETIDGSATRIMYAGERVKLRSNGAIWRKVSGLTIPMLARMTYSTNQSIPASTVTQVLLDTTTEDSTGLMASTSGHSVTIQRSGYYAIEAGITYNGGGAGGNDFQARVNLNGTLTMFDSKVNNATYAFPSCQAKLNLSVGDIITLDAQQNSPYPLPLEFFANTGFLAVTEIPQW